MSDYITELRKLVGSKALIMCGACVIFIDDFNRILLQRRTDNGMWGLPGGMMEPGETLQETAMREAYEEVGLACHDLKLLNIYSGPQLYYRYPNGDEVYNVSAAYLCRDFSGIPSVDLKEVVDIQFFALIDLPPEISPPVKPILDDFCMLYGIMNK